MAMRDLKTGRFVSENRRYKNSSGYIIVWKDGREYKEHRLIWEALHGPIPEGFDVHHINGDPADNDPSNLRLISHSEHTSLTHKDRIASDTTRQRISEAKKGSSPWNKGRTGYKNGAYTPRTTEHSAKLSAALKGRTAWNKGKTLSEEHKTILSAAHKGQHSSPATEFKKGQRPSPATEFKQGQVFTEQHRQKMSEAQKRRHAP